MNKWDRVIFDGKCPYTSNPCDTDIDCTECNINKWEREKAEEFDRAEYEETKAYEPQESDNCN